VAGAIFRLLSDHCDANDSAMVYFAPVDYEVTDEDIVQPDVLVISRDHPQFGKSAPRLTAPPLLAVEVLSPGSTKRDREEKFILYRQACVPNYWIADPKTRSLEAWSLVESRYVRGARAMAPAEFSAEPFAGLVFPLARVFKFA
jgi:Uma2 family endonuclease